MNIFVVIFGVLVSITIVCLILRSTLSEWYIAVLSWVIVVLLAILIFLPRPANTGYLDRYYSTYVYNVCDYSVDEVVEFNKKISEYNEDVLKIQEGFWGPVSVYSYRELIELPSDVGMAEQAVKEAEEALKEAEEALATAKGNLEKVSAAKADDCGKCCECEKCK